MPTQRSDEERGLLTGAHVDRDPGAEDDRGSGAAAGSSSAAAERSGRRSQSAGRARGVDGGSGSGGSRARTFLLPGVVATAALLGVAGWTLLGRSREQALAAAPSAFEQFAMEVGNPQVEAERKRQRSRRNRPPTNLYAVAMDDGDSRQEQVKELTNTILRSRRAVQRRARNNDMFEQAKGIFGLPSGGVDCHMDANERCPISEMHPEVYNTVWPGGNTRCLTGKPYNFNVIPGDTDKLLIFFSGGGACWEEGSAKMQLCTLEAEEEPQVGMLDRKNILNPFRSYTLVSINYCSGDVHVGNAVAGFTGPGNVECQQRGYVNAKSAIDWAKANLAGEKLTSFVIAGASAGAIASKVWARTLLQDFNFYNGAVIADSFVGVFPQGTQGVVQKQAGLCSTGLLSEAMTAKCEAEVIDIHDVYDETIAGFPDVVFANINSKSDVVQMAFHDAIRMSLLNDDRMISQAEWSRYLRLIENFHSKWPNFVTFDVNSRNHEYTNTPAFWWAQAGGMKLRDWLAGIPVMKGGSLKSFCTGKHGTEKSKSGNGWDLCSDSSANRVYKRAGSSVFR